MKTTLDPRRTDETRQRAGESYGRTGRLGKQRARAAGYSTQRDSQVTNGDPSGAPQRFYVLIEQLARHAKTSPWPLILGAQEIVQEVYAERDSDELWDSLLNAFDEETREEAEENVATHRVLRAWERGAEEEKKAALLVYVTEAQEELYHQMAAIALARVLLRRLG